MGARRASPDRWRVVRKEEHAGILLVGRVRIGQGDGNVLVGGVGIGQDAGNVLVGRV